MCFVSDAVCVVVCCLFKCGFKGGFITLTLPLELNILTNISEIFFILSPTSTAPTIDILANASFYPLVLIISPKN